MSAAENELKPQVEGGDMGGGDLLHELVPGRPLPIADLLWSLCSVYGGSAHLSVWRPPRLLSIPLILALTDDTVS